MPVTVYCNQQEPEEEGTEMFDFNDAIKTAIKGQQISDAIDAIDNKTIKDMAIEIIASKANKVCRRGELKVAQCRNIVFQAAMFGDYQL